VTGFARSVFEGEAGAAGLPAPPTGALADYARLVLSTPGASERMRDAATALLASAESEARRKAGPDRAAAAVGVDPGASHTGVVLARLAWSSDGVPSLAVADGVTIDRRPAERVGWHAGAPLYARRVVAEITALLDRHSERCPSLVAVESLVGPSPVRLPGAQRGAVSARVAGHAVDAAITLGAVAGAWPDAWLSAPADADHRGDWPPELRGRRPRSWSPGGNARQHQRAAWSVLAAGLEDRQRWRAGAAALALADTRRSLSALLAAASDLAGPLAQPGEIVDIAMRAAVVLDPATPPSVRERLAALATAPR
jgi:hypothetical protein